MTDCFRPYSDPARFLYDSFQEEAMHRPERNAEDWIVAERNAMWRAARDYAQQHGLRVPTMAEVQIAESSAMGHVDYGAKWAYRVAEFMQQNVSRERGK